MWGSLASDLLEQYWLARSTDAGEHRDWHSIVSTAEESCRDIVTRWKNRWLLVSILLGIATGLAACHLFCTLFSTVLWERLVKMQEHGQVDWPLGYHVGILFLIFSYPFVLEVWAFASVQCAACEWAVHYIGRRQRSFAITPHHSDHVLKRHVERLKSQIEASQCLEAFLLTACCVSEAPILQALATAGRLEVLILDIRGFMGEREIAALHQCLKGNRRLRALSLQINMQFSSDLGAAIAEGLKGSDNLEYINVSGANWEGLSHELCEAVRNMPHLRELRLLESWGIVVASEELLETAIHHCPDLRVFRTEAIRYSFWV